MNILTINISASIIILITLIARKLFKNRIPHTVFCVLWFLTGLRLLIPVKISSSLSIWNMILKFENSTVNYEKISPDTPAILISDAIQNNSLNIPPIVKIIWFLVVCIMGIYFFKQYISILKRSRNAKSVEIGYLKRLINSAKTIRPIKSKVISGIVSPATFGIFHPVIFFPKKFDFENTELTKHIVLHELGHIKYFHTLLEVFSSVILCLYWYNPLIWVMYFTLDKDMEISADRYAVEKLGKSKRKKYALTLVSEAESKIAKPIFYYSFKNNLTKERIESIVKYKKLTWGMALTSVIVPMFIFLIFSTTDSILTNYNPQRADLIIDSVKYAEEPQISETAVISIPHKTADKTMQITNYEYTTYGKIPPKFIQVTATADNPYSGSLELQTYSYFKSNDKFIGLYSGTLYLK